MGCHLWGRTELGTTERLHFHVSLSRIGEGNGNPLQCSCLENPRDGGAWWAAVRGVAQTRTRLKRLSSSSHTHCLLHTHTTHPPSSATSAASTTFSHVVFFGAAAVKWLCGNSVFKSASYHPSI